MTTDKCHIPATAPMWWDGGDRAITAREKATIEEHGPSCFTIPLVPAISAVRCSGCGDAIQPDAMLGTRCRCACSTEHQAGEVQGDACDDGGEYYAEQHGGGAWATYQRDGRGWVYNFGHADDAEIRAKSVARELNRQVAALAARQPGAQEPRAWLIHWAHHGGQPEATTSASRVEAVGSLANPPRIEALYTAPPAQAVDLGQFREAVEAQHAALMSSWCGDPETKEAADAQRDRLLSLIDQRDAAPGVGNG